ncbi:hypothetical protein [Cohnella yongneupensis]|uniref:Lipoprotein n=1 Tax=Cohnella yongneupensis TaxID=425006 RepID=A0ABW0QV66_9BACL
MKVRALVFLISLFLLSSCGSTDSDRNKESEIAEKAELNTAEASTAVESEDEAIKSFVEGILTDGSYSAEVMVVGLPGAISKKMERVTRQMQESLAEHKEWYLNTIASLEEGEPMPYDERLGITEEEYTFVQQSDQYMKLIKQKDFKIRIRKDGEKISYRNDESPVLKEFTLDTRRNTISTELGEFTYDDEIVASDDQKVTGRWNGHAWRLEKGYEKAFQITIGKKEDSDQRILYIKLLEAGKERKEEFMLF